MPDTILEITDLVKEFNGIRVLDGINISVERGSVHAVVGENGAGKTTIMNILGGIYPFGEYSGKILIDGSECRFSCITDSEKCGIAVVHQELSVVPNLSIAENVFLGNEIRHGICVDWYSTYAEARRYLDMVGIAEQADVSAGSLGTGKQQLVEIAKALAKSSRILILDEPTASLNDFESAKLLDMICTLREHGLTCIIISHKLNEIASVADMITVIREGKTIETIDNRSGEVDENRIIRGMIGREMDEMYPRRKPGTPGAEMLRVSAWNVGHPVNAGCRVVDNVSFYVRHGEIAGFYGLQGSGRTELAMSMFGGAYGVNISGRMEINGKDVCFRSPAEAITGGMVYVTEDRASLGLILDNDVVVNTTLAGLKKLSGKYGIIDKDGEEKVTAEYTDKMNIRMHDRHDPVRRMSGGNQQKVLLSKWLYTSPDILIFDEPTRGIDVAAKYEIYRSINEFTENGGTVVMISSDLNELIGMSDRIYIMSCGCIVDEVCAEKASREKIMASILRFESEMKSDGRRAEA